MAATIFYSVGMQCRSRTIISKWKGYEWSISDTTVAPPGQGRILANSFHKNAEDICVSFKMSSSIRCPSDHPRLLVIVVYRMDGGGYLDLCIHSDSQANTRNIRVCPGGETSCWCLTGYLLDGREQEYIADFFCRRKLENM